MKSHKNTTTESNNTTESNKTTESNNEDRAKQTTVENNYVVT